MLHEILGLTDQQFVSFFLAFLRIVALISVAPLFGSRTISIQIKIFLSLFLTVSMLPIIKDQIQASDLLLTSIFLMSVQEVLIGLFLGFYSRLIFEAFQFAGRLVGNQMGLGVAELIDPDNGAQVSPIGNIYSLTAIVLFLSLNGHHFILSALYQSFHTMPLDSGKLVKSLAGERMLSTFNDIFTIGIKLAAPSMVTLFLIEVSMGIIARTVPQMNIFFIGLPLRLGVGLFILLASLPLLYMFFGTLLNGWQRDIKELLFLF
jgi:flagellar biosynthetic protein FliR